MMQSAAALMSGYLVGSLPTGYWYAWYLFGVDVTAGGSRNTGATNVARLLKRRKHFIIVWGLDALKAAGLLVLVRAAGADANLLLATAGALLLGNGFSCFLRFKGGKGIATTCGILLALYPLNGLVFITCSALLLMHVKRVDAAVLASGVITALIGLLVGWHAPHGQLFWLGALPWIFYRHRDNLRTLF